MAIDFHICCCIFPLAVALVAVTLVVLMKAGE